MSATNDIVAFNKQYVASRKAEQLPLPPSKRVAVLTCMDARILPEAALGIQEGQAHVIRNAGGRAPEALRSLIISQQLLNTEEILVIQHSDCGMLTFTSEQARGSIAQQLELGAHSAGAKTLNQLDFLEFPELEKNVRSDVDFLKNNELIKGHKVTGYIYDVKTGAISRVA